MSRDGGLREWAVGREWLVLGAQSTGCIAASMGVSGGDDDETNNVS